MKEAQPSNDFAASLIEVYGDIRSKAYGLLNDAKYEVGPLPMDRPKRIISFSLIPIHLVKYS